MNPRRCSALALAIVAGATASVFALSPDTSPATARPASAPSMMPPGAQMTSAPDFRSGRWMSSRPVVNANNESIADASEFILDRGSARVAYIVVKTGSFLGMGGRSVAIPFTSFGWETGDRLVLNVTPEQLK
jgi:hypothetical protein